MKEETKLFYKSFELPNNGLRAYLHHVEDGNDTVIRTPLFDGKDPEQVLDSWQKVLEPGIKFEGLLKFENDLRSKVGPLSVMKPLVERMDDIESYYESIYLDSKPIEPEAIQLLLDEWVPKIGGLRLRKYPEVWHNMQKSTNSGAPFFTKRRKVYEQYGTQNILVDGYWTNINGEWYDNCAVLGWRGQEGGPEDDDVKQRVIWMFPMYVNMAELSFYQPFIEACQRFDFVPAWNGMEFVDREMTLLFDSKGKDDLVIATDFTKFDQHFNFNLQTCAEHVFKHLLTPSGQSAKWLNRVWPIKYDIPLCIGWERVLTGAHGMASGSGGTNADETVAHKCLQLECALNNHAKLNPHSQCLGDDGIISFPGISVDSVLKSYSAHGLEMNESKQYASTDETTYLRRWYHSDYRVDGKVVGVYSTYRALGKLMYQERFYGDWSKEMVVLRALSIIENCKYHPMKEEFLDYCIKGDKYRLGLDIPGFLSNIETISMKAKDRMHNFMSYSSSFNEAGIKSWWVIQALKARA